MIGRRIQTMSILYSLVSTYDDYSDSYWNSVENISFSWTNIKNKWKPKALICLCVFDYSVPTPNENRVQITRICRVFLFSNLFIFILIILKVPVVDVSVSFFPTKNILNEVWNVPAFFIYTHEKKCRPLACTEFDFSFSETELLS